MIDYKKRSDHDIFPSLGASFLFFSSLIEYQKKWFQSLSDKGEGAEASLKGKEASLSSLSSEMIGSAFFSCGAGEDDEDDEDDKEDIGSSAISVVSSRAIYSAEARK